MTFADESHCLPSINDTFRHICLLFFPVNESVVRIPIEATIRDDLSHNILRTKYTARDWLSLWRMLMDNSKSLLYVSYPI